MDWLRRNRRRLAVGGGVLGGLYIVGRWHKKKSQRRCFVYLPCL